MIGRVLGDRYEIISEVGSGGMAIVYKAKCKLLNRYVALKILKDQYREDKEFVARFIRESQAAASLSNPNIVSVFDVGNDGDINYIVMELVEGITLKEYIEKNGMLNWRLALKFAMQICSALADAHRNGIIHRDIKPHNVIVTSAGNCKVADFGIACSTSNINETKKVDEGILGSVHYISPEHAKGVIPDERSDLYSLGITMYEMLTGRLPFDGDSAIAIAVKHLNETPVPIKDINIAVPLSVVNIVNKAIAKKNEERYQSAREMYDDMEAMAQEPDMGGGNGAEVVIPAGETVKFEKEDVEEIKKQVEEEIEKKNEEAAEELKEDKKKKGFFGKLFEVRNEGDKKAVIFALITSAVLILTVLVISLSIFVPSFGIGALFTRTGSEMEMPSLVGEQIEDMQDQYKKEMKFVIEEVYDNEYAEGEIISHEPLAGMNVKTPVKVAAKVSKGAKEVKVPNLIGKSSADAIKLLKKEGLKYKEEAIYDENAAAGVVVKQSPIDGATAKTGDVVIITVSKGEDEEMAVMPELVGKTEEEARILVDEAELKVAIVKKDSDKPKGQVTEQNFPKGTELSKNTVVTITVSTGIEEKKEENEKKDEKDETDKKEDEVKGENITTPEPVTPPVEENPSGSNKPVENNPPQSKTYNLNISLPSNKERVNIIVKQGGMTVYDNNVSTAQGTLSVPLYGMGTVNVEVYQDGLLVRTQKVTF